LNVRLRRSVGGDAGHQAAAVIITKNKAKKNGEPKSAVFT
jgi:hypothetical protein